MGAFIQTVLELVTDAQDALATGETDQARDTLDVLGNMAREAGA